MNACLELKVWVGGVVALLCVFVTPPLAAEPAENGSVDAISASVPTALRAEPPLLWFRLANGLEVVVEENRRQPEVAIVVAYGVGSRDDPRGYAQLAHLVEHMSFRGSRHLKEGHSWTLLQRAGAWEFGGLTHPDFTEYFSVVPASAFDFVLFAERERMAFTLENFTERSFRLEQSIIRNEGQLLSREFNSQVARAWFGSDDPYSRAPWGLGDLDAIGLSDTQWFYQSNYRPDNARLIVVGDVDAAGASAAIARYFGSVVALPKSTARAYQRGVGSDVDRVVAESPSASEVLTVVWQAPRASLRDQVILELFRRVLNERLQLALDSRRLLSSEISVGLNQLEFASTFQISVVLSDSGSHERVEAVILEEFEHMQRADLSLELARAKAAANFEQLESSERPRVRAEQHLRSLLFFRRPSSGRERFELIQSIVESELRRPVQALLSERRLVAAQVKTDAKSLLWPWRLRVHEPKRGWYEP